MFKAMGIAISKANKPLEIGEPFDLKSIVHVTVDENKRLAGLPKEWEKILNNNQIEYNLKKCH